MNISPYLKLMVEKKASDLYFTSNAPVKVKIEGKQIPVGKTVLTAEMVKEAAYGVMNEKQIRSFEVKHESDFAIAEEDVGRFRVNVFMQRSQVAMVLRYIPSEVPKFDNLSLPPALKDLILHKRGLLLMVGSTGSGKSTTLAAMVNHCNDNRPDHIITIEDPIEFVHESKRSLINQREVHRDTLGFSEALRSALREDPDVILVGEMRDLETIRLALTAAETGHLVFGTLHTSSAAKTIDRVVDVFPGEEKAMVRSMLSESLRAVISQTLLKRIGG
ncbi:MAG: type IV pilus twitching motility protein PilT, partial [Gammaproteobacteria bacterium]